MTDEIKTTKCEDCGKDGIKNMGSHNRFCPARKEKEQKREPIKSDMKHEKKEGDTKPLPLIISHVQPCLCKEVAWFADNEKRYCIETPYIGIVDGIPTALILIQEGIFIPANMHAGFIGMYPVYQEFADIPQEPEKDDESFPPFKVEEEKDEFVSPKIEDTKPARIITPPENKAPIKKASLLSKLLGKNKKVKVSEDTKDLLKQAIST